MTPHLHNIFIAGHGPAALAFSLTLAQMRIASAVSFHTNSKTPNLAWTLSPHVAQLLEALGVQTLAHPIHRIHVDASSSQPKTKPTLQFQSNNNSPIAFTSFNTHILQQLSSLVQKHPLITKIHATAVHVTPKSSHAVVSLSNNSSIHARLLVDAAAGALQPKPPSSQAKPLHILTAQLHISPDHDPHAARQSFLPLGPVALLPTAPNQRHLVWNARNAKEIHQLTTKRLAQLLRIQLHNVAPNPRLDQPPTLHMLQPQYSLQILSHRRTLIGDAARTLHPLAGAGFNLAVRDAFTLAQTLAHAQRSGADPGNPLVLQNYAKQRRPHSQAADILTNALRNVFLAQHPARPLAAASLPLIQALPSLKQSLIRYAVGPPLTNI